MIDKSKKLAYLLRHDDKYNFSKPEGWREVKDLIENHGYTISEITEIVKSDKKGRYEVSEDETKIRAVQGHSIPGILPDLEETLPPPVLYHGTSSRFLSSIFKDGIQKRSRNHVHLSADIETAKSVGLRHGGETVILKIDTEKMSNNGIKFLKSKNGVWLCDEVKPEYFEILNEE